MEQITNLNRQVSLVYGEGPRDAKIMIIGEAPGSAEEKSGRPFIGTSGQLLEDLLYRAGIPRKYCYITNVVKERPPKNDISAFLNFTKRGAEPRNNYEEYEEYLRGEIEEVDPNLIICVGRVPLWAVCRKMGITKWRGSLIESTLVPGKKVMPVIHPAAALRQYLYQHFISFDLMKAKQEAKTSELKRVERDYLIRPDFFDTMQYIEECKKAKRVGFDIETTDHSTELIGVSCISLSYSKNHAISIPFIDKGQEYFAIDQEAQIWQGIGEILEDPEIEKVAQNTMFDASFLFNKFGIKPQNIHDTMIMCAILYPDFPKGLDFITSIWTEMPYYKDDGKAFFKGGGDQIDEFWLYNARDSIVLLEAFPKMMAELERQGNAGTYEAQRRLLQPLLFMTYHGIKADSEGLAIESARAGGRLTELESGIEEIVGRPINPRSPTQLKEYFYGSKRDGNLGLPPYRKDGKPTTDEKALTQLSRPTAQRDAVPVAQMLLEHRSLTKLKGTYLDMKIDEDQRIRCSMNPVGTRTGRLSSSKNIFGTGANMQNQPPIMKKFMLPDKDYVAYDIDLSQAENRLVAYIAPEPRMIEAFEGGIDIHSRTASYIFGLREGEISDEKGSAPDFGDGTKSQRFWGKKANHAFNYGQSARAFSKQMLIAESEGKIIHGKYHSGYPGVRKYHNWIEVELRKSRTLTNLFGRKYTFLDRWGYSMFLAAYAFIPQSTIADIINRWGLDYIYSRQDLFEPVRILNQVHDSIVIQIHKGYGVETHVNCLTEIVKNLQQPLTFNGRKFIIPCDIKVLPTNLLEGTEIPKILTLPKSELIEQVEQAWEDG